MVPGIVEVHKDSVGVTEVVVVEVDDVDDS